MLKKAIKNHKKIVRSAIEGFRGRMWTSISAAFAFVIALSWNDTIKKGVDKLIASAGLTGSSYLYSIIASVLVTAICVLGIYFSSKTGSKNKN